MTIKLDASRYVHKFWFLTVANKPEEDDLLDMLVCLSRPIAGGDWLLQWRFRYGEEKAPPRTDRTRWYQSTSAGDAIIEAAEKFVLAVSQTRPFELYEVDCRTDGEQAAALMAQQPWCHFSGSREPAN